MRTSTWLACTLASGLATASVMIPPALLSSREVSPDNTCGNSGAGDNNGYTCPESLPCCSKNGWCGSTTDYCGTGCQSAFGTCNSGSNPERCGPDFNNQKCGSSQCCSEAGYCGTTADHCMAPGCQTQFGPACDANTVPEGTNTSSIARPKLGNVVIGGAGLYVCNKPGTVALTYDDGPYDYTGHLLNLLNQYGAKATFFITGINNGKGAIDDETTNWPKIIRRMHNNGHHIASHTWSHADLSTLSSAARKNEMYKNEMALRNILGFIPTYMRPPYSSCTSASGCPKDLKDLGYHIIYFDLDTSDYLNTTPQTIQKSKDKFDDFFVGKDSGVDDGLAIAHDIHWQTVNNLTEYMLQGLQDRGYRAVTLGECLNDPKANWYREV